MSAREKIAYLKGLLDGLGPVKDEGQNKIFSAVLDALDALAPRPAPQVGQLVGRPRAPTGHPSASNP